MTDVKIIISDRLPVTELLALREHDHIDRLTIYNDKTVTTEVTKLLLKSVKSIGKLSIWQTMTRTALRDCFALADLHTLELRDLTTPGKMVDASQATNLQTLRCDYVSSLDLAVFSRLPLLTEIRAHSSQWTSELLARFVQKPTLRTLDVEASELTDEMMGVIAKSATITELDIGASRVSGKGLADIVTMRQLESLDIWATRIGDADLPLLRQLEHLQCLAIGGQPEQNCMTADGVIPSLLAMPSLEKIWLHNVFVDGDSLEMLKSRFEHVQYDYETY